MSTAGLEQEVEVLKRQVRSLRREVRELAEYVDTVSSPLWKRLVWWCEGFYFRKVGRWYCPGWTPRWPR
mgnify:FL=1